MVESVEKVVDENKNVLKQKKIKFEDETKN